jgi:hypothetical protein
MNRGLCSTLLTVIALHAPLAIPDARADSEALLEALTSTRAQALTIEPGSDAARALPRPSLVALRGVSRARLRAAIGVGDYCGRDSDCAHAHQAAYYFFKPDDSPPDRPGRWVLVVYFNEHDEVADATWFDAGAAPAK